jgi:hypothetical protein
LSGKIGKVTENYGQNGQHALSFETLTSRIVNRLPATFEERVQWEPFSNTAMNI